MTYCCGGWKGEMMDKTINKIAEHYGYEAQSMQLIEEMAELTVAINKCRRFSCIKTNTVNDAFQEEHLIGNIIEEIADVEIMLEQIKHLMGCQDDVTKMKELKVIRQIERMR